MSITILTSTVVAVLLAYFGVLGWARVVRPALTGVPVHHWVDCRCPQCLQDRDWFYAWAREIGEVYAKGNIDELEMERYIDRIVEYPEACVRELGYAWEEGGLEHERAKIWKATGKDPGPMFQNHTEYLKHLRTPKKLRLT